jgi:hypothetical protein
MARRWSDLTPGTRRLLLAAGAVESALKLAALLDLARRPRAEVRGPKWRWALAITLVNSLGAVPAAYFVYGRRRAHLASGTWARGAGPAARG